MGVAADVRSGEAERFECRGDGFFEFGWVGVGGGCGEAGNDVARRGVRRVGLRVGEVVGGWLLRKRRSGLARSADASRVRSSSRRML